MTKTTMAVLFGAHLAAVMIMAAGFDRLSDHSVRELRQWVLLYLAAVVAPSWWTIKHDQEFRRLTLPMTATLRHLTWSPLVTGLLTLLLGLALMATARR